MGLGPVLRFNTPASAGPVTRSRMNTQQGVPQSVDRNLVRKLLQRPDKIDNVEVVYDVTLLSDPNEPKTIQEALQGPEAEQWKESAKEELDNFIKRKSWRFVSREEAKRYGKKVIGS